MISIRKSADEMDRLDNLRQTTSDCYGLAIQASAEYAVEVDAREVLRFRQRLTEIGERWKAAGEPGELRMVGQIFCGELREYQRSAGETLDGLRREVEAAADAISTLAGGIASQGASHEEHLNRELERLATASQSDDVTQIRSAIQTAISRIHVAIEQMHLANRLAIAQMQDEIRVLHQEMDARRHRPRNPAARLSTRSQMEQKIDAALDGPKPFCLLLIAVTGWKSVATRHSPEAIEAAIQQMINRLRATIDRDLVVGRWTDDEFVAMLNMDPATAIAFSREAASALSGAYEIEVQGQHSTMQWKVKAGVIDRAGGSDSSGFRSKLAAVAAALSKA